MIAVMMKNPEGTGMAERGAESKIKAFFLCGSASLSTYFLIVLVMRRS